MKAKSKNKYFLQEFFFARHSHHGGIGCNDMEEILKRNKFDPIQLPFHFDFSLKAKVYRCLFVLRTIFSLPSNSVIVFQSPLYAKLNRMAVNLILTVRKSIKMVCIVTDISGIRDGNQSVLVKEISLFNKVGFVIAHNDAMKDWLRQYLPTAKITTLEFFDYLSAGTTVTTSKKHSVAFAGFLDKSVFVSDLCKVEQLTINLYGLSSKPLFFSCPTIKYHGVYDSSRISEMLDGSFGLVWDGTSISGLEGTFGEYTRLNSPNKISLYIITGLPVIAHRKSAVAQLIFKYGIGFTVNSLYEISGKIDKMSEEQYQQMKNNCIELAKRIKNGNCLTKALDEITNMF